eukprot:GHVP01033408.1.p1 GENE.GHVP01033408.1~~GHVP01033408.1.p1  ORF type:complete len:2439 (-),score=498.60 GHVP01033408.1:7748-15064(-)
MDSAVHEYEKKQDRNNAANIKKQCSGNAIPEIINIFTKALRRKREIFLPLFEEIMNENKSWEITENSEALVYPALEDLLSDFSEEKNFLAGSRIIRLISSRTKVDEIGRLIEERHRSLLAGRKVKNVKEKISHVAAIGAYLEGLRLVKVEKGIDYETICTALQINSSDSFFEYLINSSNDSNLVLRKTSFFTAVQYLHVLESRCPPVVEKIISSSITKAVSSTDPNSLSLATDYLRWLEIVAISSPSSHSFLGSLVPIIAVLWNKDSQLGSSTPAIREAALSSAAFSYFLLCQSATEVDRPNSTLKDLTSALDQMIKKHKGAWNLENESLEVSISHAFLCSLRSESLKLGTPWKIEDIDLFFPSSAASTNSYPHLFVILLRKLSNYNLLSSSATEEPNLPPFSGPRAHFYLVWQFMHPSSKFLRNCIPEFGNSISRDWINLHANMPKIENYHVYAEKKTRGMITLLKSFLFLWEQTKEPLDVQSFSVLALFYCHPFLKSRRKSQHQIYWNEFVKNKEKWVPFDNFDWFPHILKTLRSPDLKPVTYLSLPPPDLSGWSNASVNLAFVLNSKSLVYSATRRGDLPPEFVLDNAVNLFQETMKNLELEMEIWEDLTPFDLRMLYQPSNVLYFEEKSPDQIILDKELGHKKSKIGSDMTKEEREALQLEKQNAKRISVARSYTKAYYSLLFISRLILEMGPPAATMEKFDLFTTDQLIEIPKLPIISDLIYNLLESISLQYFPKKFLPMRYSIPKVVDLIGKYLRATSETKDEYSPFTMISKLIGTIEVPSHEQSFPLVEWAYIFLIRIACFALDNAEEASKSSIQNLQSIIQIFNKLFEIYLPKRILPYIIDSLSQALHKCPILIAESSPTFAVAALAMDTRHAESFIELIRTDKAEIRLLVLKSMESARCNLESCRMLLYLAQFDQDKQVQTVAKRLVQKWKIEPFFDDLPYLTQLLSHESFATRYSASEALGNLAFSCHDKFDSRFDTFVGFVDNFWSKIEGKSETKLSLLQSFSTFISLGGLKFIPQGEISVFNFLFSHLADPEEKIVRELTKCGLDTIEFSTEAPQVILERLNQAIELSASKESASVRSASAELLGATAKHLKEDDPQVAQIIRTVIQDLTSKYETGPETQIRIGKSLIQPLKRSTDAGTLDPSPLGEQILQIGLTDKSIYSRTGAHVALAALVCSQGVKSLKEWNVVDRLQDAAKNQNDPISRQAALSCFKCIAEFLGRIFEPYFAVVQESLLTVLGDPLVPVRTAAMEASKVMMSNLSPVGFRVSILPELIRKTKVKEWRIRQGAVQLLGSVDRCNERQLAAILPQIIPVLSDVVNDSQPKVREAAISSLEGIMQLVQNDAMKNVLPILKTAFLNSSQDNIQKCVSGILNAEFTDFLDPASLGLMFPILCRGLRGGKNDTKKQSAKIIGLLPNLARVPRDFEPYYVDFKNLVVQTLMDTIPDVRFAAATCLGHLAKHVSNCNEPLARELLELLPSCTTANHRSGTSSAISQVLPSVSPSDFISCMDEIIENMQSDVERVREGFIGIFVYLPSTCDNKAFQPFIPRVLNMLLSAARSSSQAVADVAHRASESIINVFAPQVEFVASVTKPLEDNMFDPSPVVRKECLILMKTVIQSVSSTKTTSSGEEESIAETGTRERIFYLLSTIYLMRSDSDPEIHREAHSQWKALVPNTTRTLQDISKILLHRTFHLLGQGIERQTLAAASLKDLMERFPIIINNVLTMAVSAIDASQDSQSLIGSLYGVGNIARYISLKVFKNLLLEGTKSALCRSLEVDSEATGIAVSTCLTSIALLAASEENLVLDIMTNMLQKVIDQMDEMKCEIACHNLAMTVEKKETSSIAVRTIKNLVDSNEPSKNLVMLVGSLRELAKCESDFTSKQLPWILEFLLESASQTEWDDSFNANGAFQKLAEEKFGLILGVLGAASMKECSSLLLSKIEGNYLPIYDYSVRCSRRKEISKLECESDFFNPRRRLILLRYLNIWRTKMSPNSSSPEGSQEVTYVFLRHALTDPCPIVSNEAADIFCSIVVATPATTSGPDWISKTCQKEMSNALILHSDYRPSFVLPCLGNASLFDSLIKVYQHALLHSITPQPKINAALSTRILIEHAPKELAAKRGVKVAGPFVRLLSSRREGKEEVRNEVLVESLRCLISIVSKAGSELRALTSVMQSAVSRCLLEPSAEVRQKSIEALKWITKFSQKRILPILSDLQCEHAVSAIRMSSFKAMAAIVSELGTEIPQIQLSQCKEQCAKGLRDSDATVLSAAKEAELACLLVSGESPRPFLDSLKEACTSNNSENILFLAPSLSLLVSPAITNLREEDLSSSMNLIRMLLTMRGEAAIFGVGAFLSLAEVKSDLDIFFPSIISAARTLLVDVWPRSRELLNSLLLIFETRDINGSQFAQLREATRNIDDSSVAFRIQQLESCASL